MYSPIPLPIRDCLGMTKDTWFRQMYSYKSFYLLNHPINSSAKVDELR